MKRNFLLQNGIETEFTSPWNGIFLNLKRIFTGLTGIILRTLVQWLRTEIFMFTCSFFPLSFMFGRHCYFERYFTDACVYRMPASNACLHIDCYVHVQLTCRQATSILAFVIQSNGVLYAVLERMDFPCRFVKMRSSLDDSFI